MNRSITRSSLLALAIASLCLVPSGTEAQPTRNEARQAEARAAAKQNIWWNQEEKINELSLTADQRQLMDAKLDEYFQAQGEMDRRASLVQFREAMQAGDLDLAKSLIGPTADAYNAPMVLQMTLSVEVLSLLQPEQMAALQESFPALLSRPWVRLSRLSGRAGAPGRPRAKAGQGGQRDGG